MTGEFSAGLYGHNHPKIMAAIENVIKNVGLNVGATTAQEQRLAHEICSRFDVERVRFTNSGTEANLHALAAARLFTGKRKVVAFGGAYHGAVLGFKEGTPAPNNVDRDDWIVARYNDLDNAVAAIQRDDVAAVIVEGMQGSSGCICGTPEFLTGLQEAAKKVWLNFSLLLCQSTHTNNLQAGVLFMVDEVMTSRTSEKGLSHLRNLKPDLKTFGKYLGGGVAFGAFGGRADVMAVFDPRVKGTAAHSGTFNNNTLVTHAGYAGLSMVYTPQVANEFTKMGDEWIAKLNAASEGTRLFFSGIGTLVNSHFIESGPREISNAFDVKEVMELKALFWFEMLEHGFWTTNRGYISLVLGTPQSELDRFVDCVKQFIAKHQSLLAL